MFDTLPASTTNEQIADLIVSENLRRRPLTAGQLAFLDVEVESHYAEPAASVVRRRLAGTSFLAGDPEGGPASSPPFR